MPTLERSIEVEIPASTAYATWTQFELFPQFMQDVESVTQLDDRHLRWRAEVWGQTEQWEAEITEQIPDKRIAWTSNGGTAHAGGVTFHRLSDDRSRVMLQLHYDPSTWSEKIGDALGIFTRRIEADLAGFKEFAEGQGAQIRGWKGEIPAKSDAAQASQAGTESSPSNA
jgi:uncharacterized membrane protein